MKTTVTLPNGMRIVITKNSDPGNVQMFNKAFERLNK
jgi:hypothetical protein